jgi:hypothetical protein
MTGTLLAPIPAPRGLRRSRFADWLIGSVFAILVAVALTVAAFAATLVGLIVAVAALILKLSPARARDTATLEGVRTADGWIVDAGPRR